MCTILSFFCKIYIKVVLFSDMYQTDFFTQIPHILKINSKITQFSKTFPIYPSFKKKRHKTYASDQLAHTLKF